MWFFREIFRLIWTIALATVVAAAVAGVWTLLGPSSGTQIAPVGGAAPTHAGFAHNFAITCLIFGALLVLLSGAGNAGTASARRADWGIMSGFSKGLGLLSPPVKHRPGDPTVTATAVFIGGGIVLLVLGFAFL
jgi:hypothetical protein